MPSVTLGLGLSAVLMRQVRSSLLEVLHQDYMTTARAKGLAQRAVVLGHALKNALIPVVTVIGLADRAAVWRRGHHREHLLDPGHRPLGRRLDHRPATSRSCRRSAW